MKILKPRQFAVWASLLVTLALMNNPVAMQTNQKNATVSPPLLSLIKSYLTDHPQLQVLKAELQAAKANLRAADKAIYNPELELDYEDAEVKTQIIGISQTIDWGNQQGSRTAVAQAELNMAMANYEIATQAFISKMLTGLAEHQTESELAVLSQKTLKLMQEFRDIAENRYQAGDLNQVDLNLARLAYNQAIMEQANALSNATEARENLRSILGSLPSSLPALPEQLPEPELQNDIDVFLQQLPIVQIQLAELQVAQHEVTLRKSEKAWDPTISVSAGSEGEYDLVGFNLSIPLNIRNSFSAEVDAAQQGLIASEQRTQLAYRDTRSTMIVTTERYRNLLNAWNNWRKYSRNSVNQQLKLIKQLWQAGDVDAANYLMQLKQALDTQATGLKLRNQLWQVAFDWMSLTASIDSWLDIDTELLEKN